MSPPYYGDLATGTVAIIILDLVYVYVRPRLPTSDGGRRERALEAAIVALLVSGWGLLAYPALFTPAWHGAAGVAMYGLLTVPIVGVLFFLGKPLIPPIGAGGVVFILMVIGLAFLNMLLPGTNGGRELSNLLSAPFLLAIPIGLFIGVYVIGVLQQEIAEDDEPEYDPIGFAGEPTPETPDPNSTGGPSSNTSPSSHTPSPPKRVSIDEVPQDLREQFQLGSSSPTERIPLEEYRYDWRYSETSFDNIGGYYDLKDALHEDVLKPLRAAQQGDDRYTRFGIEPERGILLYGPPGTGKTMFARALAGELNIPFVELSPADVTSMWVNESSDQVKTLFSEADEIGQCIIFLDEAEHLFGAREHTAKSAHAEDRKVTSEFLAQLTRDDREAIVVSATNRPGDIDRAILRPGRLTAHFEVGLPVEEARHAILKTHLKDIPSRVSGDEFAALARHTGGLTGADLANLVGQARRSAAHRDASAVTREDFPSEDALEELSAELAAAHETGELPDADDGSDTETTDSPEAKAGVRADDEGDSGPDGPARGYQ